MNWLLDADVASQASKPRPDAKVNAWLAARADDVFLSALTLASSRLHGCDTQPSLLYNREKA